MLRFIFGILCGVLAVIFVAQNTEIVDVTLLFWTVTVSRAIMYGVLFVLGLLVGWLTTSLRKWRKRRTAEE